MKPLTATKHSRRPRSPQAEPGESVLRREAGPAGSDLYRRAQAQLKQRREKNPEIAAPKSDADPRRLLHELQVHQVELELQNAELLEARGRLESLLEKYTVLYDFAPAGYLTLSENGTIRLVNLTGARLVGVERSRLVGRSFGQLVNAPMRRDFGLFLKQVFEAPERRSGDFELASENGSTHAVNIEAQRSVDGQECRVVVTDVTDRRQAEALVRLSEVRYRRLFETAHDGVLLLDPGTRKIKDANPFMTRLLGYPHDQLVGKELFEIGLLKDETASQVMFQKLKRSHEVRYENLPLESKGGRHQEVEVVANLYRENGQEVIQCNIRDITVRKLAELDLRASEERYRILFDLGPVAVYSCDADGVIQKFNAQAARLWGRSPKVGDTDQRFCGSFKLFKPDGRFLPHARCPMAQVLKGNIAEICDQEVLIERPDATRLTCVVNIRPLLNERGEITGAINCFYDITERKRTEASQRRIEVLAASNQKLEKEIVRRLAVETSLKRSEQHQTRLLRESRRMQGQLRLLSRQVMHAQEQERKRISRELHDVIAQILTGINLRLANLKQEALNNPAGFDRNLARTQQLVEQSVAIVHRFARELRPAVLDDFGLVPALHSFLKNFTTQTGIRTSLTAFAGVEHLDTRRRTVLYRVAQEALTNVARHAHASRVQVKIESSGQVVRLKIKDDGRGFSAGRSELNKSKRLGLLGMRERVEMIHGSLAIKSVPGKGTTICAEVPQRGLTGETSIKQTKKAVTRLKRSPATPQKLL